MVTACNTPEPICNLLSQGAGALTAIETTLEAGGYDIISSILVNNAAALYDIPQEVKDEAVQIAQALCQ